MAVLEKIRVKFGLLASLIIAFGLLLFIVDPSSVMTAVQNMSSKYDVGEINGKSISYTDFQQDIQTFTTINEIITGSSAQGTQQQARVREAAWQDLIYRFLFIPESKKAGIYVGDKEIVDITTGKQISPILMNNPVFMDQNGRFSKQKLISFLQSLPSDQSGRAQIYWNYLQNSIVNQRYFEKYASLFTSSMFNSPVMLKDAIKNNNTTSDVQFVMVPYSFKKDSSIVVSNSEVEKYYDNHKKFFKQQASRDIEYVVFEVKPSKEDILANQSLIANIQPKFASTENIKNFLLKYSDKPYVDYWYKKGDLNAVSPEVENFAWGENKENVSGVLRDGNNFYLAKVLDSKYLPDSVYVKHILLQGDKAEHIADSLVNVINHGGNFSNLAAEYSIDKQSAMDGQKGNIGWMTESYMIPGFQSVFTEPVNKPFVLKTKYGTHVVIISKETKPVLKKQVAILVKETMASKNTFNTVYSQANTFASLAAGSLDNYNKAVDSLKVYSHKYPKMLQSTNKLGSIDNTKEITRWVFDNKVGKVSEIKTIDNNFFIITAITGSHKEGYADFKEVSPSIKEMLYNQKNAEKQTAEIAAKVKGIKDLQIIADKLNTTVSTKENIAFDSMNNQGLDPSFIGALSVAPQGKICGPIKGNIGSFIFKVTKRDVGSFYTDTDAKNNQQRIANMYINLIIPIMMQDADVKDLRAKFY